MLYHTSMNAPKIAYVIGLHKCFTEEICSVPTLGH